jgi:hypothetical protein
MKEMQCKQCKNDMYYDSYYHCYECNCGKTYNAFGNELAPKSQWKDEYEEEY